jgi:hypothetical protein
MSMSDVVCIHGRLFFPHLDMLTHPDTKGNFFLQPRHLKVFLRQKFVNIRRAGDARRIRE